MAPDFTRNLRLVGATVLLCLWGYSHLVATPLLGDTILPLVLGLFIAPGGPWIHWRSTILLATLVMLIAATALLYFAGTDHALSDLTHSPYFVVPVWLLGLVGLVRNATSAERLAAHSGTVIRTASTWVGAPPADAAPKRS